MQQYFYDLADFVGGLLQLGEVYTTYLTGENSDFCRFSAGKVRQAGGVKQHSLSLRLINGQRHAQGSLSLSSDKDSDRQQIKDLLGILRDQLAELPEDPYLLYATEVQSSEARRQNLLPDSRDVVASIIERARGLDLVGIYAAGSIYRGFANSLGQRNWYESYPFNLDWSLYLQGDKAVKTSYAGFVWEDGAFAQKLADAKAQLAVLNLPPRTIKPGQYTVYLAPPALAEVTDMLSWNAFGLKAHRTKQTSLLKMVDMVRLWLVMELLKKVISPEHHSIVIQIKIFFGQNLSYQYLKELICIIQNHIILQKLLVVEQIELRYIQTIPQIQLVTLTMSGSFTRICQWCF